MDTIETINFTLTKKLKLLYDCALNENNVTKAQEIHNVLDEYFLNFAIFFVTYFSNQNRKELVDDFSNRIQRNGIFSKINELYSHQIALNSASKKTQQLLCDFSQHACNPCQSVAVSDNEICNICSSKLDKDQTCRNCGYVNQDYRFVIQFARKNIRYNPTKHCKLWLQRIQGIDLGTLPDLVVSDIRACFIKNNIKKKEHVSCALIRKYLQLHKYTEYNDQVPLIRKKIADISPPILTAIELEFVYHYFDLVVQIFAEVKPYSKLNCPYHPYFIYKILEQIILDKKKRYQLLECIHLQSRNTLIQNDKIWQRICKHIANFTYTPTIRERLWMSI